MKTGLAGLVGGSLGLGPVKALAGAADQEFSFSSAIIPMPKQLGRKLAPIREALGDSGFTFPPATAERIRTNHPTNPIEFTIANFKSLEQGERLAVLIGTIGKSGLPEAQGAIIHRDGGKIVRIDAFAEVAGRGVNVGSSTLNDDGEVTTTIKAGGFDAADFRPLELAISGKYETLSDPVTRTNQDVCPTCDLCMQTAHIMEDACGFFGAIILVLICLAAGPTACTLAAIIRNEICKDESDEDPGLVWVISDELCRVCFTINMCFSSDCAC